MAVSNENVVIFIESSIEEEIMMAIKEREMFKSIDWYRGYQNGLKQALTILRSTGKGRHGYED